MKSPIFWSQFIFPTILKCRPQRFIIAFSKSWVSSSQISEIVLMCRRSCLWKESKLFMFHWISFYLFIFCVPSCVHFSKVVKNYLFSVSETLLWPAFHLKTIIVIFIAFASFFFFSRTSSDIWCQLRELTFNLLQVYISNGPSNTGNT